MPAVSVPDKDPHLKAKPHAPIDAHDHIHHIRNVAVPAASECVIISERQASPALVISKTLRKTLQDSNTYI